MNVMGYASLMLPGFVKIHDTKGMLRAEQSVAEVLSGDGDGRMAKDVIKEIKRRININQP